MLSLDPGLAAPHSMQALCLQAVPQGALWDPCNQNSVYMSGEALGFLHWDLGMFPPLPPALFLLSSWSKIFIKG